MKFLFLWHLGTFWDISAMGRELQKRACGVVEVVKGFTFSLIFPDML